jgi:hypothetical protein
LNETGESPASGSPGSAGDQEVSDSDLLKRFLEKQQAASEREGRGAPPIDLSIGPDGRVVIRSDDARALDLLEELIGRVSPPKDDFKIFYLTHADAYWVKLNLVEYFEDKEEDSSGSGYPFFYSYRQPEKKEPRSRLSQRRELKFIYDLDTNSILVQGGDPKQLKTVEQLIEIYDKPVPTDSKSARVTSFYFVKFSKASIIADTIKEVYRDLLSSSDKALAGGNPEKKNRESSRTTVIYGGQNNDEPERTQIRFKGKLSLGVDAVTNTLLISCEGESLMANVTAMVKTLDTAAQPLSTV